MAHRLTGTGFQADSGLSTGHGTGIRNVYRRFLILRRNLKLFSQAPVAIDGSKFKASNSRDRNFTTGKIDKRQQQIEESIQRYLSGLETADRTRPPEHQAKTARLQEKTGQWHDQMDRLEQIKEELKTQPDGQFSLTSLDARSMATSGRSWGMVRYNVPVFGGRFSTKALTASANPGVCVHSTVAGPPAQLLLRGSVRSRD